jgi:predicted membrane-bound mannosyltransferase
MLIVAADLEDRTLAKNLGTEYTDYCNRTPFLVPKVSLFGFMKKYPRFSTGKPLRYIIWFLLYWCVVSLILYGFTFMELHWTL